MCNCGGDFGNTHDKCTCRPKLLDLGKPIQTKYGERARIICTDRRGKGGLTETQEFPLIVLITRANGEETIVNLRLDGTPSPPPSRSVFANRTVINVPERIKGWVNLYISSVHPSETQAKRASAGDASFLKTIYIETDK